MQRFWITHGQDGTKVRLEEIPLWAQILEEAGEWAAHYLLPGHKFCCDIPEWAWKVEWGKWDPKYKIRKYSLGLLSWRFSNWIEMGFGAWHSEKDKGSVSVSYEWVQEHFPELGSPYTDGLDSDDAMESTAKDPGDVIL